ncbi:MAG: DUF1772 domain-containing protein [Sphingomicrobium sp.]
MPLAGIAALVIAALFAGAAVYVSAVEHPARMTLDTDEALREWGPSYHRGAIMQASLALLGTAAGAAAWWMARNPWWLAGAIFMLANWPWTLLVIMPLNRRLKAMAKASADSSARELLDKWARLHLMRTAFGILATLSFAVAAA